jgi:hypothetical protein
LIISETPGKVNPQRAGKRGKKEVPLGPLPHRLLLSFLGRKLFIESRPILARGYPEDLFIFRSGSEMRQHLAV